jgi:hypothetical protein
MLYSVYNNRYNILTTLDRLAEAEEVFRTAEKLLIESKMFNELYELYDIKVRPEDKLQQTASA